MRVKIHAQPPQSNSQAAQIPPLPCPAAGTLGSVCSIAAVSVGMK